MTPFIVVDINELPATFFDAAALLQFWMYVKWTMKFLMPVIMICGAAYVAHLVLDMILGVFDRTTEPEKDYDYEEY